MVLLSTRDNVRGVSSGLRTSSKSRFQSSGGWVEKLRAYSAGAPVYVLAGQRSAQPLPADFRAEMLVSFSSRTWSTRTCCGNHGHPELEWSADWSPLNPMVKRKMRDSRANTDKELKKKVDFQNT